ncbi:MAG: hypothetical protein KF844_03230 [Cryobacterium sp.]|nr:hypothetical protein [Cryobacterium sp.]
MESYSEILLQAILQGLANASNMFVAMIAQNPWPVIGFAALAALSTMTVRQRRHRAR